ncbi:enoyl-CoA hydratase/isomerase family protein [Roseitranquillus sediminis]|uniref:enoyl-CoA hydratase/isomerase family protein n=1 Tax=Roseitranquillus sediminis TaxID=2809051 RepID=UPI001D0CC576|nr:enoyl-CoA hydratase/isomerase family protein [Roseitranquillus sediminis]MBM9595905.1 enoyl-CoA hydratase/isomerase family protein [Roseitranquillus sediminis]
MTDTDHADELLYEERDGIGWITLNRPHARNSMTFAMYERLAEICEGANGSKTLKALVITGAGEKAFAAGTDISQFRAFKTEKDVFDYEARIDRVLEAVETVRQPTLAAISGACTGGGAAIAACCDLRIGAASTRIGYPVARTLGNTLSMNNFARLKDLIGSARAKELIFTARLMQADEALALGLLTEILPDHDALMTRADELARHLASMAPLTLQAAKTAFLRLQVRMPKGAGEDLVRLCYNSNDFREGMEAFLAKRPPQWTGT